VPFQKTIPQPRNLENNFPGLRPLDDSTKPAKACSLVTNDSEWAARIAAPETHLDKTYHAQIARVVEEAWTQSLPAE
jgi:23S rRNA pseudouridine2605 synthase